MDEGAPRRPESQSPTDLLGQLDPDVRQAILATRPDADNGFTELAIAYAETMMLVQTLERAVACAVEFLHIDGDAEDEAKPGSSLRARFNDSIDNLIAKWPADVSEPPNFKARLHDARKQRNALVHDFWLQETFKLVAFQFDNVRDQLAAHCRCFEALIQELFGTIFVMAITRRDITASQINTVSSAIVTVQHFIPDELAGLDLFTDGEEVLRRVTAVFESASSPDELP